MQEIIEAIILGIVQGLTEFLPVSSSGHLEIFEFLFGENASAEQSILMTVTLHGATALSTVVVFKDEILEILQDLFKKGWNNGKKWATYIILSMIPAALFFVLLEDWITSLFVDNIFLVACMLIVTGLLLFIADRPFSNVRLLSIPRSFIIGIAQAIAIIPGISRSGSTIATALLLGIERKEAARFSFLMVLPLIFGKVFLDLIDGDYGSQGQSMLPLLAGALAAFLVGYAACKWMIQLVRKAQLRYFAYYCFFVAISLMLYLWLN